MKHVAIVHNNVDQRTSIGKLAAWSVQSALDADLRVTVVARDLDEELRSSVSWKRLVVPPRVHAFQWAVARRTVVHALRGVRPDVLHVYQPQIAALADTWHVEYLSRVAIETGGVPRGNAPRIRAARAQQRAVAAMEDAYLRRLGPRPTVLFCSAMLAGHFRRLYGTPTNHGVLANPAFAPAPARPRAEARRALGVDPDAYVVGYLGGVDERKGYRELLDAVCRLSPDTTLLVAGPGGAGLTDAGGLGRRLRAVGMLEDMAAFWAAVDVLAVPSRFEPFGMVVTEAAANGVPVVVTPEVGAAGLVARHRAGEVVGAGALDVALGQVRAGPGAYDAGLRALAGEVAAPVLSRQLLQRWWDAWDRNAGGGSRAQAQGENARS